MQQVRDDIAAIEPPANYADDHAALAAWLDRLVADHDALREVAAGGDGAATRDAIDAYASETICGVPSFSEGYSPLVAPITDGIAHHPFCR